MNKQLFKSMYQFKIRDLVEIAIYSALAIIFDKVFGMIKLGSTGGSLNIAALPLFICAIRLGPIKGFIAGGVIFGLISNLLDGYGINTYPMEYLISFGVIGLAGFSTPYLHQNFTKNKNAMINCYILVFLFVILWFSIRLAASALDSALFYGVSYIDGIIYCLPFCLSSAIAVYIFLAVLMPVIHKFNHKMSTIYLQTIANIYNKEEDF